MSEKQKFKVGDIVECVEESSCWYAWVVWNLYTIKSLNWRKYSADFIEREDWKSNHGNSLLRFKLHKPKTPDLKYKVWDKVIFEEEETTVVWFNFEDGKDDEEPYIVLSSNGWRTINSYDDIHRDYQGKEYRYVPEKYLSPVNTTTTPSSLISDIDTKVTIDGWVLCWDSSLTINDIAETVEKLREGHDDMKDAYMYWRFWSWDKTIKVKPRPMWNNTLYGTNIQDLRNSFNPFNQQTTMTKIDKHLKAKYFTNELIEETADLIEQAETYKDSLEKLSMNVDFIIRRIRDRVHDIKESIDADDIRNHEQELLELKSALKELGNKDITTLLAIWAKWTPKKETTIKSILPN